jgi:hypothetical protein
MASMRIEFTERFISQEEKEYWENIKVEPIYHYRKIYPCLSTVDYPREIPGDPDHCEVLFKDDYVLVVKGTYQDIALQIDDRESQEYGEE